MKESQKRINKKYDGPNITRTKAAEILNVDPQTISNYAERGIISMFTRGRKSYVKRSEIEDIRRSYVDVIALKDDFDALEQKYRQQISEKKDEIAHMDELVKNLMSGHPELYDIMNNPSLVNILWAVLGKFLENIPETDKRSVGMFIKILEGRGVARSAEEYKLGRYYALKMIAKLTGQIESIRDYSDIRKENEQLKKENAHLKKMMDDINERSQTGELSQENIISRADLMPLENYEFTTRTKNVLSILKAETVGDLVRMTEMDIMKTRNCGRKTLTELRKFLESKHMSFLKV